MNFDICLVFRNFKNEYFLVMNSKILWIYFGGHHKGVI